MQFIESPGAAGSAVCPITVARPRTARSAARPSDRSAADRLRCEKRVIGEKDVGEAAFPLGLSQFPHAARVLRTLDVEKPFCVVVEHQSDDRPGEEIRPQRTYGSVERREPLGNASHPSSVYSSRTSQEAARTQKAHIGTPAPFPTGHAGVELGQPNYLGASTAERRADRRRTQGGPAHGSEGRRSG